MKISLIIPVYNEEKYIEKCLKSIARQKVKPDEVIVVNNNSTDSTEAIVRRYSFVKIINEAKQGMIPARNAGFNTAQNEIIARCDADTILPANWISRIHRNFIDMRIDALTGLIKFYDAPAPFQTPLIARASFDMMKLFRQGEETLTGPNMIITKEIWKRVKDTVCVDDKLVHEDIDLSYHIQKVGGVIKRDNRLVVGASIRRAKNNPYSFFAEYPKRFFQTLLYHDDTLLKLKETFTLPAWYTGKKSRKKK